MPTERLGTITIGNFTVSANSALSKMFEKINNPSPLQVATKLLLQTGTRSPRKNEEEKPKLTNEDVEVISKDELEKFACLYIKTNPWLRNGGHLSKSTSKKVELQKDDSESSLNYLKRLIVRHVESEKKRMKKLLNRSIPLSAARRFQESQELTNRLTQTISAVIRLHESQYWTNRLTQTTSAVYMLKEWHENIGVITQSSAFRALIKAQEYATTIASSPAFNAMKELQAWKSNHILDSAAIRQITETHGLILEAGATYSTSISTLFSRSINETLPQYKLLNDELLQRLNIEEPLENQTRTTEDFFLEKLEVLATDQNSKSEDYKELLNYILLILLTFNSNFSDIATMNAVTAAKEDNANIVQNESLKTRNTVIESLDEIINTVHDSEARVIETYYNYYTNRDSDSLYIVTREAVLRIKPTTKSPKISVLLPTQKVSVLKSNKRWAYVEYFDQDEKIPKTGWVFKKKLKRMKN